MNDLRMNLILRDITIDKDFRVTLPVEDVSKIPGMIPGHEYIVVENNNVLRIGELCSIDEANEVLQQAEDKGFSLQDLMILSSAFLYEEVKEIVENGNIQIYDFDGETSTWNFGNGGNHDPEDYGRFLYEQIGYNSYGCRIPEQLLDHIEWESNWNAAEAEGFQDVRINNNTFIVKACAA